VRLLLDSNALIWWVTDDLRLSRRAYHLIESRQHEIFVSFASLWEITIKIARGNLPQVGSSIQYLLDEVREQRFELLPVRASHLLALGKLDHHHRDPFDRMLIAQSVAERVAVITSDPLFSKYPVSIFW
jgi:PIN domain nuclease of toxin-antitoxin system